MRVRVRVRVRVVVAVVERVRANLHPHPNPNLVVQLDIEHVMYLPTSPLYLPYMSRNLVVQLDHELVLRQARATGDHLAKVTVGVMVRLTPRFGFGFC